MPFANKEARAQYMKEYWERYYAKPENAQKKREQKSKWEKKNVKQRTTRKRQQRRLAEKKARVSLVKKITQPDPS